MHPVSILHISTSLISASILIYIGIDILLKNKNYSVNRAFFLFFAGLSLSQLFDGLLLYISLLIGKPIEILRDISVSALIIGTIFGMIGIINIHSGTKATFRLKYQIIIWGIGIIFLILAIIGDSAAHLEQMHIMIERNTIGWIGTFGTIFTYMGIGLGYLFHLYRNMENNALKHQIIILFLNLIIIYTIIIIFELSYGIIAIAEMLVNFSVHIIVHGTLIVSAFLILKVFSNKEL